MSLFSNNRGGSPFGPGSAPTAASNERLESAAAEIELVTDLFNRLVRSCQKKCIGDKFHEGMLNKGEGVCLDRCSQTFAVLAVAC